MIDALSPLEIRQILMGAGRPDEIPPSEAAELIPNAIIPNLIGFLKVIEDSTFEDGYIAADDEEFVKVKEILHRRNQELNDAQT